MADRKVYAGIGSNLGDRESYIKEAICQIETIKGIKVVRQSSLLETKPLAGLDQPDYLNTVVELMTRLSGMELLHAFKEIENDMGRDKDERWSSRCIDIDLLLDGEDIIKNNLLAVPHQQMHLRSFVLEGLCELDEGLRHPVLNVTVRELLERLNGKDYFLDEGRPQLISIAGLIGAGKTTLADALALKIRGEVIYEPYDENPYLARSYKGRDELALNSQIYFLLSRSQQLGTHSLESNEVYISDYVFEKELIYADRTLKENEAELYRQIYERFKSEVYPPVLLLYVSDSVENCLEKIRIRHREFEQNIPREFLEGLFKDYEKLISEWSQCPVIKLDMCKFDCNRDGDLEWLFKQVKEYIT